MGRVLRVGLGAALVFLVSCGGPGASGFATDRDGGGGSAGSGGGGSGGPPPDLSDAAPGTGTGTSTLECSAAAKLVYVIDDMGVLHSFDPGKLAFTTIGPTNCPGAEGTNSMAIDRSATAWVNDVNGKIYKVNTADGSCESTTFIPGQHGFGPQFGMGFSSDADGGTAETLYVDGLEGAGLATIDLTTLILNPIAHFGSPLSTGDCELTGTGDGRLYGFFTNTPASVAQIDKVTAAILDNVPQAGVSTGTDWAFSFWGGSFYLYTADTGVSPLDTSDVTQYDPMGSSTAPKVVMSQIGFRIVGAGVSTCAPLTPPPLK
jgi:hypothetical protein